MLGFTQPTTDRSMLGFTQPTIYQSPPELGGWGATPTDRSMLGFTQPTIHQSPPELGGWGATHLFFVLETPNIISDLLGEESTSSCLCVYD